ncbi:tyrosine-type recombinase/integrase [Candidatus Thiodictyon syntrophicum]|nr:site-specific integrase [Candidatus Thiodictyon syntrophicum]
MKLTATFCKNTKEKGMHLDGHGLYLRVQASKKDTLQVSKSWLLRWGSGGRNTMGFGRFPEIGLADARALAADAMQKVALGIDPRAQRDDARRKVQIQQDTLTFREACKQYIEKESPAWKNVKHEQQWNSTLETYALPILGDKTVEVISLKDVLSVLEPIWNIKNETATRVRSRLENILDWAITHGHRTSDNPARWKGRLEHALPAINKRQRVKHHPALSYRDLPDFLNQIKMMNSLSARALEFTILTACRTNEVIGARWEEIDLEKDVWTIPKERMKAGVEQLVPISKPANKLLKKLKEFSGSKYVFQSDFIRKEQHISNMAMLLLLKRMNRQDITVHGFRSTFRDWGAEQTEFAREVLEHALSHRLADGAEAAYQRGTMLDKRRELMNAWGGYCFSK